MMHEQLPPELQVGPLGDYLAQIRHVKAVVIGESLAQVYRLSDAQGSVSFLKVCPPNTTNSLADDAARLTWLSGRLPVPKLLDYREETAFSYLLMSAIPGVDAATLAVEEWMAPAQLVRLLAIGLRQIHAVPVVDCPFDHRLAHELVAAQRRVEQGRVDEEDFDAERQGRSASSLLEELFATAPTEEELVFTHGDYCLPNIMLAENRVSGFIDIGLAGIGDRYRDLALVRRSLIRNCGAEWVPLFFETYGLPRPDEKKLAFYQLLDEFY